MQFVNIYLQSTILFILHEEKKIGELKWNSWNKMLYNQLKNSNWMVRLNFELSIVVFNYRFVSLCVHFNVFMQNLVRTRLSYFGRDWANSIIYFCSKIVNEKEWKRCQCISVYTSKEFIIDYEVDAMLEIPFKRPWNGWCWIDYYQDCRSFFSIRFFVQEIMLIIAFPKKKSAFVCKLYLSYIDSYSFDIRKCNNKETIKINHQNDLFKSA